MADCCTIINPEDWDYKRLVWKNKLFIMDKVTQFLHMPLNMGQVVSKMFKKIEDSKASTPAKDFLMLAYDPSPWVSEIYMSVTKKVPGAKMVKLSGAFIAKAFDGPYSAPPKWIKVMDEYLAGKKLKALKYYFYFTMCPKCVERTGHNYAIVFAKVK